MTTKETLIIFAYILGFLTVCMLGMLAASAAFKWLGCSGWTQFSIGMIIIVVGVLIAFSGNIRITSDRRSAKTEVEKIP